MINSLRRCLGILNPRDRLKVQLLIVVQVALSILDLLAVTIFGALGTIAVRGVQSKDSSNFLDPLLVMVGLGSLSFQAKVAFLALSASVCLIVKTILSALITRRSLHFLAKKGAELSIRLSRLVLLEQRERAERYSSQDILYNLTQGVNNITLGVLGTTVALAADLSLLVLISTALFVTDFVSALATTILFLGIGIALYYSLHRKSAKLGKTYAETSIQNNNEIITLFKAYPEIFVRNSEMYFLNRMSNQRAKLASISAETAFLPYVGKYVIETAIVLGVLLLSSIQFFIQDAAAASGNLAFFIASATRIAPAVLRLQHGGITINYSANASSKTLELMEECLGIGYVENISLTKKHEFESSVEFKEVSYGYEGAQKSALSRISFSVAKGDFVAIVGPTGAGKSTLVEVLLGIRSPKEGEVLISGVTAKLVHQVYPGKVAYVPQEVFISHGSIRDNLLLGQSSESISDEKIKRALESVGLRAMLEDSNLDLDSTLGEEGSSLSGGQKQRIGIARAILTDPELLILDEATSSLDGLTELEISKMISKVESISTMVVIAHRLSTIRDANKLIYLEDGSIKFVGTIKEARTEIPDFDLQAKLMGLI